MDNSYGLLEIQSANLYILKEIKRVCEKYKLDYVLDAGTLLGAVRHRGFIPWDDDVDIAMTRESFEVFKKIAKKELEKDLTLLLVEDLAKKNKFYDFTPKIVLERSKKNKDKKEDEFYEEKLNHLCVDIFILDKLAKNKLIATFIKVIQKFIYLLAMGHRYKIDYKKYSTFHKILIFIFSNIGKLISMNFIFKLQDKLSKLFMKSKNIKYYYSNYQPDYLYVDLDEKIVNEKTSMLFEDEYFNVPKNFDEVLKIVYGTYMKLPPEDKRKPSHFCERVEIYE